MDYEKACEILDLEQKHLLDNVKKAYFKQALKWHPDKPNGNGERFKEIKAAYDFLLLHHNQHVKREEIEYIPAFTDILKEFLDKYVPDNKWDKFFIETSFNEFMKKGVDVSQKISLDIFKSLSTKRSLELYEIISKFQYILYIDDELMNNIKENLREKMSYDNIIVITPSIDDMLNDNIYKLEIDDDNIIYVPLWHRKIYNSIHNDHLMIMIIPPDVSTYYERKPKLYREAFIKDNNDIYIKTNFYLSELFDNGHVSFNVGEKTFTIDSTELKITKESQMIILKNKGILRINKNDIYQKIKRGHIIIEITLI